MTKYNVVVINAEGVILGAEEYDPTNDGKRDGRVYAAVTTLAEKIGIAAPAHFRNSTTDAAGNDWMKATGDMQPGMVEVGFGKWRFPQ